MTGPALHDRAAAALAFANTPDDGYDGAAEAADALEAWLADRRLIAGDVEVTSAELSRFLRLRDAMRAVLEARIDGRAPEDAAVRILEAASLAAPGAPIGVWEPDGTVALGWRSTGGDPLDRAAAMLATDLVDLVVDHGDRLERGPGGAERFSVRDSD
jgi:predicted RNA-binding Zn ribbon-like protein